MKSQRRSFFKTLGAAAIALFTLSFRKSEAKPMPIPAPTSILDETLTKEEIRAVLDTIPLGYITRRDWDVLESYADRVSYALMHAKTGQVKIKYD